MKPVGKVIPVLPVWKDDATIKSPTASPVGFVTTQVVPDPAVFDWID